MKASEARYSTMHAYSRGPTSLAMSRVRWKPRYQTFVLRRYCKRNCRNTYRDTLTGATIHGSDFLRAQRSTPSDIAGWIASHCSLTRNGRRSHCPCGKLLRLHPSGPFSCSGELPELPVRLPMPPMHGVARTNPRSRTCLLIHPFPSYCQALRADVLRSRHCLSHARQRCRLSLWLLSHLWRLRHRRLVVSRRLRHPVALLASRLPTAAPEDRHPRRAPWHGRRGPDQQRRLRRQGEVRRERRAGVGRDAHQRRVDLLPQRAHHRRRAALLRQGAGLRQRAVAPDEQPDGVRERVQQLLLSVELCIIKKQRVGAPVQGRDRLAGGGVDAVGDGCRRQHNRFDAAPSVLLEALY